MSDLIVFVVTVISGALFGAAAGCVGGVIGGGINGYFDPLTRIVEFDRAARFRLAKVGANGSVGVGIIMGALFGAIASVTSESFPVSKILVSTFIWSLFISAWILRSAEESIVGFPGGIIVGATLGALGGYGGRLFSEWLLMMF